MFGVGPVCHLDASGGQQLAGFGQTKQRKEKLKILGEINKQQETCRPIVSVCAPAGVGRRDCYRNECASVAQ